MTFYYVATEICRLKWNWLYLIILHCLESIGYSSPLPSLHQFVTNPTAQQLNGTGREVRWSPCYLDYSYTSPVHVQKKMYKDKTLSSLNYAPQRCSQNRTVVEYCRFTLASDIQLKTFVTHAVVSPRFISKLYQNNLYQNKLDLREEPDMSLSSPDLPQPEQQSSVACLHGLWTNNAIASHTWHTLLACVLLLRHCICWY